MKKVASFSAVLMLCVCLSQAVGQPVQPNQPNNPGQPVMAVPQPQPAPQAQRQGLEPRKVKAVRQLPRNAQMEQARQLLSNKDYQNAHSVLMKLAQEGHAEAMFFLALMHERGNGVAQNPQEAIRWYTRSALGGWSDAMFNLGQRYYKGQVVQPNLAKAADLFFLVATTGDPDGQWAFGVLIAAGEGRPKDLIEGCAWLLLAANQMGDAEAVAETLDEMVKNDGFAIEKMPAVPVPAFMAEDETGPNNQNQNQNQAEAEEEDDGRSSGTGGLYVRSPGLYHDPGGRQRSRVFSPRVVFQPRRYGIGLGCQRGVR
jgi:Sel1 repeat-containing protein